MEISVPFFCFSCETQTLTPLPLFAERMETCVFFFLWSPDPDPTAVVCRPSVPAHLLKHRRGISWMVMSGKDKRHNIDHGPYKTVIIDTIYNVYIYIYIYILYNTKYIYNIYNTYN